MFFQKAALVGVLVCMSASPALADNWRASANFPGADQAGAEHFLSPNSEETSKGVFTVGLAERFLKPKADGVGKVFLDGTLICASRSIKVDVVQKFGPHGDSISMTTPKRMVLLINAGTALDDFYKFLCGKDLNAVTGSYFSP